MSAAPLRSNLVAEDRGSYSAAADSKLRDILLGAAALPGPADEIPPYAKSLRVGKTSQAYRAHSYHTKVPPEAIEELIRHHTAPGNVVVDPFCGSGMTGVAAIRSGRHALLSDLSPAAVHIASNYTSPCDPKSLLGALKRLGDKVKTAVDSLYAVDGPGGRHRVEYTVWSDVFECPRCGREIVFWNGARDPLTGAVAEAVQCGSCNYSGEKRDLRWTGERPVQTNCSGPTGRDAHAPTSAELDLIKRANAQSIRLWIPDIPFTSAREMWRAGHSTIGIANVSDFYTRRNLQALALLRHAIDEESDDRLRRALLFAFTGIANRASKRYQWNAKRPTNVMTGTLYVSSLRYEWNVWSLFERKARDVTRYFEHLGTPEARAAVVQASATSLPHIPDGSVDYVFMDPPFGSNIFYADSSLLWDAWLGHLTDESQEIVVNKHRAPARGGKTLTDYGTLMAEAFREVVRILKPTAYATLQFNNSSDQVWCAIQDALHDAGLEVRHTVGLDKIQPSIKGVKGLQAKERVASLDALIELRRRPSANVKSATKPPSTVQLRSALQNFASTQTAPFTTDEAFSYVIRLSLNEGLSLDGVSMHLVRSLCAEMFGASGTKWEPAARHNTTAPYEPVSSPYGCQITRHLATADEIRALFESARPAPVVLGRAPKAVAGQRNTALYNAHSYHTKVPPEAIVPFLNHFSRPGDVVLDPFCGSGMTGVAAQLSGRRALLSDLAVAAAHLTFNHTRPCDPERLQSAFDELARDLEDDFREMYACADGRSRGYVHYTLWSRDAVCPKCEKRFSLWDVIDQETGRMPSTVICPKCRRRSVKQSLRYVGNRPVLISYVRSNGVRTERPPAKADLALIDRYRERPESWYPDVAVDATREMYIRSALHLHDIRSVADFYTPRNLMALSKLWERIQKVEDDRLRAALSFAFTNTAWHGTRMRRFNARGGQRPLTGTLYIPQISSEANVLEVMRNKIRQLRSYYEALGSGCSPLPAIRLASATQLDGIPDQSVDYVFTDPPFGSNIFYADCNLIWESWLGGLTRHQDEAVVNRSRQPSHGGKTVADYQELMAGSLREIHRVLKPGAWMTLVFHNTDPTVWRAIQTAAEKAGFRIEDASTLDRKQQSHKGYKGRANKEAVAHFDVVMSMRKLSTPPRRRRQPAIDSRQLVLDVLDSLPPNARTVQRVHSEVLQHLAREGQDLGAITFEEVRARMHPQERT